MMQKKTLPSPPAGGWDFRSTDLAHHQFIGIGEKMTELHKVNSDSVLYRFSIDLMECFVHIRKFSGIQKTGFFRKNPVFLRNMQKILYNFNSDSVLYGFPIENILTAMQNGVFMC